MRTQPITAGLIAVAVAAAFAPTAALAQAPLLVPFTGYLDYNGAAVSQKVAMKLTLYTSVGGTTEVWSKSYLTPTDAVAVTGGRFSVTMDLSTATAAFDLNAASLYVGVKVAAMPSTGNAPESSLVQLNGRQRLLSAPYALQAGRTGNLSVNGTLSGPTGGSLTVGSNIAATGNVSATGSVTAATVATSGNVAIGGSDTAKGPLLVTGPPTANTVDYATITLEDATKRGITFGTAPSGTSTEAFIRARTAGTTPTQIPLNLGGGLVTSSTGVGVGAASGVAKSPLHVEAPAVTTAPANWNYGYLTVQDTTAAGLTMGYDATANGKGGWINARQVGASATVTKPLTLNEAIKVEAPQPAFVHPTDQRLNYPASKGKVTATGVEACAAGWLTFARGRVCMEQLMRPAAHYYEAEKTCLLQNARICTGLDFQIACQRDATGRWPVYDPSQSAMTGTADLRAFNPFSEVVPVLDAQGRLPAIPAPVPDGWYGEEMYGPLADRPASSGTLGMPDPSNAFEYRKAWVATSGGSTNISCRDRRENTSKDAKKVDAVLRYRCCY